MPKIKILHIIKSLGRGGAETLLPETLRIHNKDKFEFHYIYFLPWKDQMVSAIENEGGIVQCISSSNNLRLLFNYDKVIKYCKDNSIDLIHCHLPWSGFLGRIVFGLTNIPVIYTEHNIQEQYHIVTKLLNKWSFNQQILALGVSKDVTRSIRENIKPFINVDTLFNGVDTDKFKLDKEKGNKIKDEFNLPDNSILIGNVAVFREQKCISDWISAFKIVSDQKENVFGILVGAGPQEQKLKSLVKELKIENRIFFPGLKTNTIPYFSAIDIFMMSSGYEGLPIALLEAMSMNCAIISTKAGGVVEVIENNKSGLLSEVGDIKALAKNLETLVFNEGKRIEFQKAARARVISNFSLISMVNNLERVYINSLMK